MTKKEVIKKLGEINEKVDYLVGNIKGMLEDAKEIYRDLEGLPSEEGEFDDEDEEEKEKV